MRYGSVRDIRRGVAEILRPPRRLRVSEAASRYLRVSVPGSYEGPWSPDLTPYMVEPMDLLASRALEAVVFVGPARSGKTLALIDAWIAYAVCCDPGDMMVVQTSQETARDFSRRRIDRMHRNSPEIGKWLSPRRNDDNTHDKHYRHFMILTIGWPSINQLSGRDIRYIALTDYDRFPQDIDGEGDPFSLAKKRTQTFLSGGMTLVESSPGFEVIDPRWTPKTPHEAPPCHGALALYNRGDRRRWHWPCLGCGEWWEAGFEHLEWDDRGDPAASAATVRLVCPACGHRHGQADKRTLLASGRWLAEGQRIGPDGRVDGTPRRAKIASFWLQGPAAAFQSWESLVYQYLLAEEEYARTGSEESLKTTVNVDQGRPYLPRSRRDDREAQDFAGRREDWPRRTVPEGVRFLTAAVDVQGGRNARFVVQVEGHGVDRERWIIDRYSLRRSERTTPEGEPEPVDPAGHPEDWDLLTRHVLLATYPLADESGREMPIRLVAVDSGGEPGVTDRAYDWWLRVRRQGLGHRAMLVKGNAQRSAPRLRLTHPDNTGRSDRSAGAAGRVPLWLVNTNDLKDSVDADLRREEPGPGYVHFPSWLGEWFFDELRAEVRTPKGWEKVGRRNEALDLMVYNRAAWIRLGGERIDWRNPPAWARPWDENPEIVVPDGVPAPPRDTPRLATAPRVRFRFTR